MSARRLWAALTAAGLSAACTGVDLASPRPYPCNPDAGNADCRGGWVCGREGVCHAAQPGGYACDPDGGDAECFGWHCGLLGQCYPLDAGVAHACNWAAERAGARSDCDEGFRCGLEQLCHPIGDVGPWRCASDLDCEGTWRCDAQGVCVDPSSERPNPAPGSTQATRLAPVVFDALPGLVTTGTVPTMLGLSGPVPTAVTAALDKRLVHFRYNAGGLGQNLDALGAELNDAGLGALTTVAASLELPFAPSALADEVTGLGRYTYVLGADDAYLVEWATDGGATVSAFGAGAGFEGITPALPAGALAWRGSDVTWLTSAPQAAATVVSEPMGTGVAAAALFMTNLGNGVVLAMTDGTLWFADAQASDGGLDWLTFPMLTFDGGTFQPAAGSQLWSLPALVSGSDVYKLTVRNTNPLGVSVADPCAPCAADQRPVGPGLCQSDAGVWGPSPFRLDVCTPPDLLLGPPRTWAGSGPPMWADAYGRIGSTDPFIGVGLGPPYYEVDGQLTSAVSVSAPLGTGEGRPTLASAAAIGWSPLSSSGVSFIPVAVQGAPSLALVVSQFGGTGHVVDLEQGPATAPWEAPQLALAPGAPEVACLTRTVEGGLLLGFGSDDVLYTSDFGPDGGSRLGPRLAPFPSLPLESLVLFPGDADAGELVRGYALSSSGVAFVEAFSERTWSGQSVAIPPGDLAELLSDGTTARVAYTDGHLITLPSRLESSEPLPGGVSALDFETFGGTDFALTPVGLFRSVTNPDGGPLTVWDSVPLPPATSQPGFAAHDFSAGQLLSGRDALYVITHEQAAFAVRFDAGS